MPGKTAIATLEGVSPYQQRRYLSKLEHPKKSRELDDAYEKRTWRETMHVTDDGKIYIPPMAFKLSLWQGAKHLSMPIPGKGKQTFTKNFERGVIVAEPLVLPVKKDDVVATPLHVPSNGQKGGGARVLRYFPTIPKWGGEVVYSIVDDTITKDVFEQALTCAGQLVGVGVWRPENGGLNGRWKVKKLRWKDGLMF